MMPPADVCIIDLINANVVINLKPLFFTSFQMSNRKKNKAHTEPWTN